MDRLSSVEIGVKIWLFIYFFGFCCVKKNEQTTVEFVY